MSWVLPRERADRLWQSLEDSARPVGLAWLVAFARTPGRVVELARYFGASAVSLGFDVAVFMGLVTIIGMNPTPAGAIGYLSGMALHYLIAVRFIFSAPATGKSHRRLVFEYFATGLMGVALTAGLIAVATGAFAAPPLVAKAISVVVTFMAVYLVRSAGVFAPRVQLDAGGPQPIAAPPPGRPVS